MKQSDEQSIGFIEGLQRSPVDTDLLIFGYIANFVLSIAPVIVLFVIMGGSDLWQAWVTVVGYSQVLAHGSVVKFGIFIGVFAAGALYVHLIVTSIREKIYDVWFTRQGHI